MEGNDFKYFWPPIGQDRVASFLEKSIISGNVAQAYIFAGSAGLGKYSLALAFARNLWLSDGGRDFAEGQFGGVTSDMYILEKEAGKKQIGVERVRDFIQRLGLSSFLNSYKIGIIKEADLLSSEAQNALLKTLEEPRERVVIILLVEDISSLALTVASRAQTLFFNPISSESVYDYLLTSFDIKRSLAKEMASAALGRPLLARLWAENIATYEERKKEVLAAFSWLEAPLSERLSRAASFSDEIEDVKFLIENWQSLWRDALFYSLGMQEEMRYPFLVSSWEKMLPLGYEGSKRSLLCLKESAVAFEHLAVPLNHRHVLESLALYF